MSDTANDSDIGIEGDAGSGDESDIVSFIINGSSKLTSVVLLGLTIGSALGNLGFPAWFVDPIGWAIQLVLMVGFTQFVANRVLR